MIITAIINKVNAGEKFPNSGFHDEIIRSCTNLENKSIFMIKTRNVIMIKENRSIILSETTVPNNELTGIPFVLYRVAQRVISPILGMTMFATYPITTALYVSYTVGLCPKVFIRIFHLIALTMKAIKPNTTENPI
jgi:hypothetical protein